MLLTVVTFVSLMDGLDGSIVNVALPTIGKSFGMDMGTASWIAVAYSMVLAGSLIVFARIAANGNIRKVLTIGFVTFTLGSLFCGLSSSFEALLVFRIIQGAGAAMMGSAGPMICVEYLPANRLGFGLAVLTLGASVGFALGPAVGGIIINFLSWHWIFLINVPIGLIAVPLILRSVPKDAANRGEHIDSTGAVLLFSFIVFGTFALERCTYHEYRTAVIISIILFFICMISFVITELKKEKPLLNIRVFKHWKFSASFLTFMTLNLVCIGMLYILPFYMQICMGYSEMVSGAFLFIAAIVTLMFCIPVSRWSDRTGNRRWFSVASCLLLAIGCAVMSIFGSETLLLPLIATMVLIGLCWAFCGGPVASRIVENTVDESREMGSSLMNESLYIGSTIGTALFVMLFTIGANSADISIMNLQPDVFIDGFVFVTAIGALISIVGAIMSFAVKDPLRT
jgi:EmrB/QacA subfamily drug resistance transporter